MTKALRWQAARFGGPEALELVDVDVPDPGSGEVVVDVRAAGMNPADYKHIAPGQDPSLLPLTLGYEVAGVIAAIGPGTEIASSGGQVGDAVIAAQISGGYATQVLVQAQNVFAKPDRLSFAEAAGLILAGATASDLLHVTDIGARDTVLLHGASGSVGVSVLQQARPLGARVIGTASERNFPTVRRYGGEPVRYGDGLEQRVRALAPRGISAAIDTAGTDEAVDVSLALVPDRNRIATAVAFDRARTDGFRTVGLGNPASGPYRARIRPHLVELASAGELRVPIGATFPFTEAPRALALLIGGHPGGKLALVVDP
jgi:NADPH:quinone reductase